MLRPMTDVEKKILSALRTAKFEVSVAYDTGIAETLARMTRDGFSVEDRLHAYDYLRRERDNVLEKLENRITTFKLMKEES